jgi:hypothetical protein
MTSNRIGPALAFYLQHAKECDELRELEDNKDTIPGVLADDWKKFRDVMDRASLQIEEILDGAREAGLPMLEGRWTRVARSRKTRRDWVSWAEGTVAKGARREGLLSRTNGRVFVGLALDGPAGMVHPYLYFDDKETPEDRTALVSRLTDGGFAAKVLDEDSVTFGAIPITAEADLDQVIAASTKCFESLRDRWTEVFAPA